MHYLLFSRKGTVTISLLLTGKQSQLSTELRMKLVGEMVKNRSFYDAGDFLKYGADYFDKDMLDSMRDETYSSFRHMYVWLMLSVVT